MPFIIAVLIALYKQSARFSLIDMAIFIIIHKNGAASSAHIKKILSPMAEMTINKHLGRLRTAGYIFSVKRKVPGRVFYYYALSHSGQDRLLSFLHDIDRDIPGGLDIDKD